MEEDRFHVRKRIKSITFGMLPPKMIRSMAVAKIVTPELYDKEGYPVDGGLMDIRLGVIDPGLKCKTDGLKLKETLGHFGYVELARPVIHVMYVSTIYDFLRCTCWSCSQVLLDPTKVESFKKSLEIVKDEAGSVALQRIHSHVVLASRNVKKCPHCGAKQKIIRLEKPTTFLQDDKRISPIDIKIRLEQISDDTLHLLGLNPEAARPEWAVLELLSVPPVTIRPSITLETGERSEDDLTHKLGDIVRINQRLFENIKAGAPEIIVEDLWDLLQYHVTTYFDNSITSIPPARHRSGQPLRTLSERIKSKEGRFRHNLAGKRVNFAARTVISPDSQIELDEVGVPMSVAKELTVPERVTPWNIERLKKFVQAGPRHYPGSNYVVRPDGKKKRITDETQEQLLEELQPGYVVERHLMDGDVSIFNRQPSLHRMSIMAHRVRVLPGKSFRLNPSVCNPYNADFDGDEMNLHIPQTEEARAEAELLMSVAQQIITPKNGLNVVGCAADAVTGLYLLTKSMELEREDAVQILSRIGVLDVERLSSFKGKVKGCDVFSAVLPSDFNFVGESRDKKQVLVKNGSLVEGYLDKATIGQEKGTLIRALFAQYKEEESLVILGRIFRLGLEVLMYHGFTSSIADTDLSSDIASKCKETIYNAERRVSQLIEQFQSGELQALPGLDARETLELKILETLNKARDKVGEILTQVADETNPTIVMAISGAKGNLINLAQMAACVGQQALRGKRIENGFIGRTLSVFSRDDLSPMAKGFVRRGYKDGLMPEEFFLHAMTGRDSLMDTALRTPKSGYLYRRLSNALQDLKVAYDTTVRDGNDNIVQFLFGEDGLDVSRTEGGDINVQRIAKEVSKIS